MKVGTESEYLVIEELERNPDGAPCAGDVKVNVSIGLQGFSGSYDQVWIELPEVKRFVSELESLELDRKGAAKISSMSPGEFTLEIRSYDDLGHMQIEVQLHKSQYSGGRKRPVCLNGGFEVHPGAVLQLQEYFKGLCL